MQAIELLAKIFVKRHKNFLRLTIRRSGWTAYRQTVRSWKQIQSLLPPSTLAKTPANFGKFYKAVFDLLVERDRRRLYEANRYKKKKKQNKQKKGQM